MMIQGGQSNWIALQMKRENVMNVLKRLHWVESDFLQKVGLLKYEACITYLVEILTH